MGMWSNMIQIATLLVSKRVLFGKKEYQGLTDEQCWSKAIEDGWRWDYQKGKFYRIIGN